MAPAPHLTGRFPKLLAIKASREAPDLHDAPDQIGQPLLATRSLGHAFLLSCHSCAVGRILMAIRAQKAIAESILLKAKGKVVIDPRAIDR
jgi:hypothetical protein